MKQDLTSPPDLTQEKRFKAAWQKLIEEKPMSAILGRVCYHPCESGCNRGQLDAPVSIHAVERYLGDQAIKKEGPLLEAERRNIDFFETLPDMERSRVDFSTVRGVQFLEPLFEFPGSCAG